MQAPGAHTGTTDGPSTVAGRISRYPGWSEFWIDSASRIRDARDAEAIAGLPGRRQDAWACNHSTIGVSFRQRAAISRAASAVGSQSGAPRSW